MKIDILTSIWNDWASVVRLLEELEAQLSHTPGLDASVWIVDDGSLNRPSNWNLLPSGSFSTHVIELQGRHGPQRALSAALGFLVCELDARPDAFVLIDCAKGHGTKDIVALLEAANRHPGSVISGERRSFPLSMRIENGAIAALFRLCTGEAIRQENLMLLPLSAAEALCHSGHAGSHLEAAIAHLQLARATSRIPGRNARESSPLATRLGQVLAAIAVFRERAYARIFTLLLGISGFFLLLSLVTFALKLFGSWQVPAWALIFSFSLSMLFFVAAAITLALGMNSFSMGELRRWTPAMDSASAIRSVKRIKREPYALAEV